MDGNLIPRFDTNQLIEHEFVSYTSPVLRRTSVVSSVNHKVKHTG